MKVTTSVRPCRYRVSNSPVRTDSFVGRQPRIARLTEVGMGISRRLELIVTGQQVIHLLSARNDLVELLRVQQRVV